MSLEKNVGTTRSILVFVFLTAGANFRTCFSNNSVDVAWILLQPISLPYPNQTMLRGPTRKLTTWLLYQHCTGGRVPYTFFNDCRSSKDVVDDNVETFTFSKNRMIFMSIISKEINREVNKSNLLGGHLIIFCPKLQNIINWVGRPECLRP